MKKIIFVALLVGFSSHAGTVNCFSENFPAAVKLQITEDAQGKVTQMKQIKTEVDMSGPKDIKKEIPTDLFGGAYHGDRKAFYFNFSEKDLKNQSLQKLKDKAGLKGSFEKGMFTIIVNYAAKPGSNLAEALKNAEEFGSPILSYASFKDKSQKTVASVANMGWSGLFTNCK